MAMNPYGQPRLYIGHFYEETKKCLERMRCLHLRLGCADCLIVPCARVLYSHSSKPHDCQEVNRKIEYDKLLARLNYPA